MRYLASLFGTWKGMSASGVGTGQRTYSFEEEVDDDAVERGDGGAGDGRCGRHGGLCRARARSETGRGRRGRGGRVCGDGVRPSVSVLVVD